MASPTQSKSSRTLYWLLGVYILASMTFYVANVAGFLDNYLDLHHRSRTPLTFDIDTQKITSVLPETQKSGVDKGDVLLSANGKPYTGMASWLTLIRRDLHPGDTLQLVVRKPNGAKKQADIVLTGNTGHPDFPAVGHCSIHLRNPSPHLPTGRLLGRGCPSRAILFAWLILIILTFTETLLFDWQQMVGVGAGIFTSWRGCRRSNRSLHLRCYFLDCFFLNAGVSIAKFLG